MTRQTIKSRILCKRRPPKNPVDAEWPADAADDSLHSRLPERPASRPGRPYQRGAHNNTP